MQEPSLFYTVLLYPFSYLNGNLPMQVLDDELQTQQQGSGREVIKLWLKGKALRETNAILRDPRRNTSDLAVAAVTGLTNYELRFGQPDTEETHFTGLKAILDARGGFDVAGVGLGIDSLIKFLDKTRFMMKGQGPLLETPISPCFPRNEASNGVGTEKLAIRNKPQPEAVMNEILDSASSVGATRLHYTFRRLQRLVDEIEGIDDEVPASSLGYSLFKEAETLYSTLLNLAQVTRPVDTISSAVPKHLGVELARIAALQTCQAASAFLVPRTSRDVIESEFHKDVDVCSSVDHLQLYLMSISVQDLTYEISSVYLWALLMTGSNARQVLSAMPSRVYATCLHMELLSWESLVEMLLRFPFSKKLSHKACFGIWQGASPIT